MLRRHPSVRSLRAAFTLVALGVVAPGAGATDPPSAEAPTKVRVTNIGLHIGGGPNDAATKAPFQEALKAVFADFEQCHADVGESKGGTFGVDLLVPAAGGHATVSAPRTSMRGEAFIACVVKAFESAEFAPSKRGATRFSYSLKFEQVK